MPDDPAKGFGTSASLDAAAAEGAKPCATAASNKHTSRSNRALLMTTHTLTSAIMMVCGVWTLPPWYVCAVCGIPLGFLFRGSYM